MARTILFLHQNFPGQYRHLAPALQARGERVLAIGGPTARELPGIPLHRYDPMPAGGVPDCHPWVSDLQTKVLRAEAVGRTLEGLLAQGLQLDLIVGHPGWGELLALKDLLPAVPVLHQVEFVYQLEGGDVGFDPEFPDRSWRNRTRIRLRRSTQLLALQDLDWGLAPTPWQASTVPAAYRQRLSVIHEGIDTAVITPEGPAELNLQQAGLRFRPGAEVVSFVARNLEPYRGFHRFMRALPLLLQLRPQAQVLIVGGLDVSYGAPPAGGGNWKDVLLAELGGQLDLSRIHFVGKIPHGLLHQLFRVCACHVYLTYPFVLSWSLLEAMACGAVVIGSATPPVQDVIEDGVNGHLVDFFDAEALARRIAAVLADPAAQRPLRAEARRTVVERFDLQTVCLPQQLALVDRLLG
ncbi:MAG: glycosyltransferase [Cyanobacteria bacterium]|nr:glycosyltransferase [Cyanobacteriota bacterium]